MAPVLRPTRPYRRQPLNANFRWSSSSASKTLIHSLSSVCVNQRRPEASTIKLLKRSLGAGPALVDLLAGQMQVMFAFMTSSIEYVRAGRLRALAVTTATRSEALPDVPSVGEFVAGYEASGWFGVGAPRATPVEIVDKLNKEINAGLADPKTKTHLADLGGVALPGSPAEFGKLIADETEKWAKAIKFAGIKPQ
jgi:tripartite-type tricarboxylate transporter receptor subunit TctC